MAHRIGGGEAGADGSVALRVEGDDKLDAQIAQLFAVLTPDQSVWQELLQRYDGNLFVGMFLGSSNEGLVIEPATAAAISERGLRLELDIYERDSA